jgi:dihydroorotate dehydrogenase (fumarate)/dihydropyrimidine dehydrogenase (NAD+) subunit PreA
MGALIGQDPAACRELVGAVRSAVDVPLIVKLTPQAMDLTRIAEAVQEAGADALTMTNRYMGFTVDIENACPHTGSWAAVGGPWVKPLSLRWIAECYSNFSLPIFGSNGAADWSDVIEFMMAGSSFVQLAGAFMLRGPDLISEILTGMDAFLKQKGYRSIKEIIGVAARAAMPYNELHRTPVQRMRIVEEACIQCGDCLNACYYGAIKNEEGSITIGDGCMGCELCLAFCSVPGALETETVQN